MERTLGSAIILITMELPIIKKKSFVYYFFKRLFDILFSLILIIVCLPIFIVVSIIVICSSKGSAFYVAERIGKNGKPFKMIKFRTMIKGAEKSLEEISDLNITDGPTFKMEDDPRITKVGRVLRKSSIDELPQLFNIFIGQMSFVGPRPPLRAEVEQYDDFARLRLMAKPGLTCIWQCSGRNNIQFKRWMELDVEYLQKRNLFFDFWILLKTIPAVITQKGAM